MPNTLPAAGEAMAKFRPSRRAFLGGIAAVSIPTGAVAKVAIDKATAVAETLEQQLARMTPDERSIYHADQLVLAMKEANPGDWDVKFDDAEKGPAFVFIRKRPQPRVVEFTGPGRYEVEQSKTFHPVYYIERAPEFDCLKDGRCFRLVQPIKGRSPIYHYESHLRTVLIRKIQRQGERNV